MRAERSRPFPTRGERADAHIGYTANAVVSHELYACDPVEARDAAGPVIWGGRRFPLRRWQRRRRRRGRRSGCRVRRPPPKLVSEGGQTAWQGTSAAFRAASMAVMASTGRGNEVCQGLSLPDACLLGQEGAGAADSVSQVGKALPDLASRKPTSPPVRTWRAASMPLRTSEGWGRRECRSPPRPGGWRHLLPLRKGFWRRIPGR